MPSDNIRKTLKELYLKLKSFLVTRDVLSFLLFLLLSSGIWFLNVLDKKRETSVEIPVIYFQLPHNIQLQGDLPEKIIVELEDEGLNLLKYKRENINPVEVNFNQDFEEHGFIKIDNQDLNRIIESNLLPTSAIMSIDPHEIRLEYRKLHSKRVPIVYNGEITPASQHFMNAPVELDPSNIEIYGTESQLNQIDKIEAMPEDLVDLNDTLVKNIGLKIPENGVKLEKDQVSLKVFVSRFTEKKLTLPVDIIHCPDSILVRTFPAEVTLTFNISMKYFSMLNRSDLRVVMDYRDIQKKVKKPRLEVVNKNQYIFNIRMSTDKVDFLLESK